MSWCLLILIVLNFLKIILDLIEIKDRKSELKEAFAKHQQTYSEQKAAIKQAEQETKHRKQQICQAMEIPVLKSTKVLNAHIMNTDQRR